MTSPIIPYIGGKRRLANKLLPMFPAHTCYVEPFCGAAAFYFIKSPSRVEVLNDINGDIVNLYRVVTHHLEEFVRQFKWAISSRKIFEWQKMTKPEVLTDIQRRRGFITCSTMPLVPRWLARFMVWTPTGRWLIFCGLRKIYLVHICA